MNKPPVKTEPDSLESVDCRLCGANQPRFIMELRDRFCGVDGEFKMVKCARCGLFYLNPRPSPETMAKYYPENYYSYDASFEIPVNVEFNGFKGWLKRQILSGNTFLGKCLALYFVKWKSNWRWFYAAGGLGKDQSVLEVGSGAGQTLRFFKKFGWNVTGVEVSEKAVLAGEKIGIKILRGDLSSQEIPQGSMDLIWMSHVFEHVYDPRSVLAAAGKILKANGRIVMEIPVADGLQPWFFGAFCPVWDAPRHLFIYTRKTIRQMASESGFEMKVLSRNFGTNTAWLSLRQLRRENKAVEWIFRYSLATRFLELLIAVVCTVGQAFNLGEVLVVELRLRDGGMNHLKKPE